MPAPAASPAPLSAAQLQDLSGARRRAAKIRRAAAVAAFDGWTMACFAVITLFGGLLTLSFVGLALGAGLGGIAFNELRARALLLRFNPRAPRILALNQIALGILIMAYAVVSLYQGLAAPVGAQLQSGDPEMDAMIGSLSRTIIIALYGSIAVFAIVAPGLTAWYYLSRAKHLDRFIKDTPPWVVQVLRL